MRLALMAATLGMAVSVAHAQDSKKDEHLRKIKAMKVSVDFKDARIDEVVEFFREATSVNWVVDKGVFAVKDKSEYTFNAKMKDVTVFNAVKMIFEQHGLAVTVDKEGIFIIKTREQVEQAVYAKIYDIRDLTFKVQDFPGPTLELKGTDPGTEVIPWPDDSPKDDITPDWVIDMIKDLNPKAWDNPGASINLMPNGVLVVRQNRKVHEEIENLLNNLRQFK